MNRWALWLQVDRNLETAWIKEDPGYKATVGKYIFRLYPDTSTAQDARSDSVWIWEISDLETGDYFSGITATKKAALEDINSQLTILLWKNQKARYHPKVEIVIISELRTETSATDFPFNPKLKSPDNHHKQTL